MSDFYEDDEPVEDVQAAFDAGEKSVTEPPDETDTTESEFDAMMNAASPVAVHGTCRAGGMCNYVFHNGMIYCRHGAV